MSLSISLSVCLRWFQIGRDLQKVELPPPTNRFPNSTATFAITASLAFWAVRCNQSFLSPSTGCEVLGVHVGVQRKCKETTA
jgi:hypothetical protein